MSAPSLKTSAKSMIILIAAAALLFAIDVGVYVMSSGSLAKSRAELSAKEDQVENSRKIAQRLDLSRARYLEASDQLRMLESSVSPAAYIPTLLKQLESTGKQVHLKVLSVRPRPQPVAPVNSAAESSTTSEGAPAAPAVKKSEPKTYDTLLIDIEVEVTYYNTMNFLQRLTQFPKIIAVDSIQILPASQSLSPRKSPLLTVQLSVRAFVFPTESGPKPDAVINSAEDETNPTASDVKVSSRKWRLEYAAG